MICWLVGWLAGWLVGWLAGWLVADFGSLQFVCISPSNISFDKGFYILVLNTDIN